ncbi:MAG TPA: DUF1598 domain-containing protein [Pirellulaceae bacterium]|jgi:hypothetical protein|nr:DUF1598 domain-containing protein [Pirellulaceae bacterium]
MSRSSRFEIACSRVFGPLVLALFAFVPSEVSAQTQLATTVQLPSYGVAIDADGTLRAVAVGDPTGALTAARAMAAKRTLPGDLAEPTELRVVSLRRLNEALERGEEAGADTVDPAALHLAGLLSIRYVCVAEKSGDEPGDVLLAGPAEGWFDDLTGRSIGITSGAPTLLLEDLATALAAYPAKGDRAAYVGCTINPRIENLARFQAYQRTIPHMVPQAQRAAAADSLRRGVAESLGLADIRTFGVEPTTHLARTLIEADYRMKSIGVGLEPPPVRMATYASVLGGSDPGLVRWWFEPEYERLRVDEAKLSLEAVGAGLKLSAEEKRIGPDGVLVASTEQPSAAAKRYADSFTTHYARVAQASPVYAEMRNAVELLVAAAFLSMHGGYERSGASLDAIIAAGEKLSEKHVAPTQVPCVANAFWKGARLIIPAGGGVSIEPLRALEENNLAPFEDPDAVRKRVGEPAADDAWWWNAEPAAPVRSRR